MKKITINGFLMISTLIALLVTGCKSQKQLAEKTAYHGEQLIKQYCPAEQYPSTDALIRARGVGESTDMVMSRKVASANTLENLSKKISVSVKGVIDNYNIRRQKQLNEDVEKRFEEMTRQVVNQKITGYRTVCNKQTKTKDNKYRTYLVYELPIDNVLKPVYNKISKDDELRVDYDYQKFKKEFEKAIKNTDKQ